VPQKTRAPAKPASLSKADIKYALQLLETIAFQTYGLHHLSKEQYIKLVVKGEKG